MWVIKEYNISQFLKNWALIETKAQKQIVFIQESLD